MSVTAPESNIKYTNEQSQQIESFKTEMLNLQTDITIGSKTLRSLQENIVNVTKENTFLEEKKTNLEKLVNDLEAKATNLQDSIQVNENRVETAQQESDKLKNLHVEKQQELDIREAGLKEKEGQIEKDRVTLDKQIKSNLEESEKISEKKNILIEAINQL